MATFGLVHGAWHGAWCWELLIPELERRGHSAVAMDLPCEDPKAGFSEYAAAVIGAVGAASDLVLVGHSLGGMTIPLVALRRPTRLLVFLCALVPERGGAVAESGPPTHPDGAFDALVRYEDGSHAWPSLEAATRTLYQDCRPALAASAFAKLRRQQTAAFSWQPMNQWPSASVASIHCKEDRAISAAWSAWVARERFGVESLELPGGHSPMLARPDALADALSTAAARAAPTR
jgi:pimeloyl-ACP methyl ester carboxylesterase